MNKFIKLITIIYVLLFLNLLISQTLFSTVIIFFIANLYLSIFTKLENKIINKIVFIELIFWIINSYLFLSNNNDAWFLGLNNLLWLLTSIKLIEVKNNINIKNIIPLLLLSIGTNTLFNSTFISNILVITSVFLLIYSLLVLNKYKSKNIIKQLIILLTFLPIAIISFFNIPSPKPWLRINSKTIAKTSISNVLKPGDISSLAQSTDLVGRVFFKDGLPKPEERYWRVYTLDHFENNSWTSKEYSENKKLLIDKSLSSNNSKVLNNEKK